MRQKQQGLTIIGLLFFSVIAIVAIYFVARLMPDYMDYWAVKRIVAQLQSDANTGEKTDTDLRVSFAKQLNVDYVKGLTERDLIIQRDRRKGVNLYVEWKVKKPFVGNISLCVDFKAGQPFPE
ncbi:MAG TPA: DUF4845 domain-containing protein [Thiobacillaceae bacterium]|nr:DUF4845 domain-containing protein [Thiobacillaceae bacterium]